MAKVAAEVGSTANSYQILAKLAVGGMAEIFLVRGASVTGVERYCVLKRILRERASDAQFARMFLDEARLVAQLQHPNIAAVYDIGKLGDSYFFTMEYVHGETVRSLLRRAHGRRRSVPLACALTIIAGAASGLHHAHERHATDGRPLGIVHRDVSPSNLMVSYEGNVKVVDFGVAKAANRAVETSSGTVKGKISYLSPEQCRGTRLDRRSDLFSLGIVMWEMLTGERLYRRDTDFESMTAIVTEPAPAPSTRRPEVPRAVDDIVLRLLAKPVADRFQTAADLVEAIENASMRAGTILSTSAVSRLVRDLFGERAEPWVELQTDTVPCEPLSFVSEPILTEVASPSAVVEPDLASIRDLSRSSLLVEIQDEPGPPPASTAARAGPARSPFSGLVVPTTLVDAGPPAWPAPPAVPVPLPSVGSSRIASPGASAPSAAPGAYNATLLGVGAPRGDATGPSAVRTAPQAQHAAPPQHAALSQTPLSSGPSLMTTMVRVPRAHRARTAARSRIVWPAIIVVFASAAGVGAVWIAMREEPQTGSPPVLHVRADPTATASSGSADTSIARNAPRTDTAVAASAESASPADKIDVAGSAQSATPAADTASARGAEGAPPAADPATARRAESAPPTDDTTAAGSGESAPPAAGTATARRAESAPPADDTAAADSAESAPLPVDTGAGSAEKVPPAVDAATGSAGGAAGSTAARPADPAAAPVEPARPTPRQVAQTPSKKQLVALFRAGKYASVVRLCSATTVTEDITTACVLSACYGRAIEKSRAWVRPFASPTRDALVKRCKAITGIDIDDGSPGELD